MKEGFSNKLTWRKFLVFVRGLPENSAFYYFCKDKENRNFIEVNENDIDNEIKRLKG